mgnify:CR=1 FL=1
MFDNTAFICIDLQYEFFNSSGILGDNHYSFVPYIDKYIKWINYCHQHNIVIFWIKSNYLNVVPNNEHKTCQSNSSCCWPNTKNYEFINEIHNIMNKNHLNDIIEPNIIIKQYYSCFHQTDLFDRLKTLNIDKLYFGGLTLKTSIRNSLEHAIKLNFNAILLDDLLIMSIPNALSYSENKIFNELNKLGIDISTSNSIMNKWGENVYMINLNLSIDIPDLILNEIKLEQMYNQSNPVSRLICIQSIEHFIKSNNDQIIVFKPMYRHPNDYEPINHEMTPTVKYVCNMITNLIGLDGYNHVLIQYYFDGNSNISAHSDKTLDMDSNYPILNVSFGQTRIMTLQSKFNKQIIEKIPLINNSVCVFDLNTNNKWTHAVKKNHLLIDHKHTFDNNNIPVKLGKFDRLSLTFRKINTFVNHDLGIIFGQGATHKSYDSNAKISIDVKHKENLYMAFGTENASNDFNYDQIYMKFGGFDCL